MTKYVSDGYVSVGYVDGSLLPLPLGNHHIKNFVSSGTIPEAQLRADVINSIGANDLAVVYVQESNKILIGSKSGFIEFSGASQQPQQQVLDIQSIVNDPAFVAKVKQLTDIQGIISDPAFVSQVQLLTNINMTAKIVDSTGGAVSNATVTQIDATTFSVSIPQQLVGTSYNIVLNKV
jgi:hypothetical protein